jgi:hypothetical protein
VNPESSSSRPRFWRDVALPISLFGIVYIGVFFGLAIAARRESDALFHSIALLAAVLASVVANRIHDGGRWRIGFTGGPATAARELVAGVVVATLVIATIDVLIIVTSGFEHREGTGVDWLMLVTLFVPAAIHEEVLMRGYPFQKFVAWNRWIAVIACSGMFALLHLANAGLTGLAIVNLFLAGVLLSLAWLVYKRLWFPIGVHIWWNILSGPVLGHEVSGLQLRQTLLATFDPGPEVLTGGTFGLEGSIWATVVEGIAIVFLLRRAVRKSASDQWPVASSERPMVNDEATPTIDLSAPGEGQTDPSGPAESAGHQPPASGH